MAGDSGSARGLHPDTIAGIVLLLLSAAGFRLTAGFPEVPPMLSQNVPPTFFPRLVLGLIAAGGIGLVAGGLRAPRKTMSRLRPLVYVTAGLVVLVPLSIVLLGTLATVFLLSLGLPLLWNERRLKFIVPLAIGMPAAVYLVFTVALEVRFPAGLVAALFG